METRRHWCPNCESENSVPKHYWDRKIRCFKCTEFFLADSSTRLPDHLDAQIEEYQNDELDDFRISLPGSQHDDPNRPLPPGKSRFYYTIDGEVVEGPIDGDELLLSVTHDTIPATVRVCKEGTDVWKDFTEIPDNEFTPKGIARMHKDLPKVLEKKNLEEAERLGKEIGSNPIVGVGCAILLAIIAFILWAVLS